MKKIGAILLIVIILVLMVGCGGGSQLNDTNTIIAERVVRAADAFLDGTSSATEARIIVD